MGFWSWFTGADAEIEERAKRDSIYGPSFLANLYDSQHGYMPQLHTTMPNLREEKVTGGNFNGIIKSSSPIFALYLARAQVFSQVKFQWTKLDGGKPTDLFGTSDLRVLERPWIGGTTPDLLARMELDVAGAGNSYYRRIRTPGGLRDRLVRLRPEWVHIVMGSQEDKEHASEASDVELVGYMYTPPSRGKDHAQFFLPEEIVHYAPIPDPDAVFAGMSWITPALKDVQGDNLQTDHKRAFLKNAATPNLAISFHENVTQEQVEAFKAIADSEHAGAWNAFKTLYLGGGADAKVLGKDFRELDFAITQGKAESRLAASAGVPPSWVGFSEGLQGSSLNAGNFTAARRRFGDGTMQHLWANVAASLEVVLERPKDASLWFSTEGIPFMHMDAKDASEVQGREAATIVALVRDGFTAESAIEAVINSDWKRLVHSNLLSVQLQPPLDPNAPKPEEEAPPTPEGEKKAKDTMDAVESKEPKEKDSKNVSK